MALFLVLEDFTATVGGQVISLVAAQIVSDSDFNVAEFRRSGLTDIPYTTTLDPYIAAFRNQRRNNPNGENDLLPIILRSIQGASSVNTLNGQSIEQRLGGSGTGDVTGPISATDNAIARYDTATGKLIQNSLDTIDDAGNIALPALAMVDGRDVSVDGANLDATMVALSSHISDTANPHATTAAQVGAPPTARTITAGSGLAGGGDLSADRTLAISVINDTQHGSRGGGALHAVATTSVAGFESAADKSKLDGIAAGATNTPLSATTPQTITDSTNTPGAGTSASKDDHAHAHGNRGGGSLHAIAIPSGAAGFMSGAQAAIVNGIVSQHVSALLGTDFSTSSATPDLVIQTAELTPVAGSSIVYFASVNFQLTGAALGATVSARLYSGSQGTLASGAVTLFGNGFGSISLNYFELGVADDGQQIEIDISTTAGTVEINASSNPEQESCSLFVYNIP